VVDDHDRRPDDEKDDDEDGSGHRGDQDAGSSDDASTEWNEGVRGEGGAERRAREQDESSRRDGSRGNEPVAEDGLELFEREVREASEESDQRRGAVRGPLERQPGGRDVGAGAGLELPELALGHLGLTDSEIAHLLRIEGDGRIFLRGPRRLLDHVQQLGEQVSTYAVAGIVHDQWRVDIREPMISQHAGHGAVVWPAASIRLLPWLAAGPTKISHLAGGIGISRALARLPGVSHLVSLASRRLGRNAPLA
jgi:hypothetical protein